MRTGAEEKKTVTMAWKVYGAEGHRQKESFSPSYRWDFSKGEYTRVIEVENSDKTGTNAYSLVRITMDTAEECEKELDGQVSDGIFENSRTGRIELAEGILNKTPVIKELYGHMGLSGDNVKDDILHGYLTDNVGRDGKLYAYYMDESRSAAIDENGNITEDEESLEALFS